jgi:hypothetical protein
MEYDLKAKIKVLLLFVILLKIVILYFLYGLFLNFLNNADRIVAKIDRATKTAIAISSVSIAGAEQKEENNP